MNGAAVQDAWVKFEMEQRRRQALDRQVRQRQQAERPRRAREWVATALPDLRDDGWAIRAALEVALAARNGRVRFGAEEVRRRRRAILRRDLERNGMTAQELGVRL